MSIIRTHIDSNGRLHREYEDYVSMDMRLNIHPNDNLPPVRGTLSTLVPIERAAILCTQLMERRIMTRFAMKTRPLDTLKASWFTFTGRCVPASEADDALRNLLFVLHDNRFPIVWKESAHGYDIDSAGKIKRKWVLDPY